MSFDPNDSFQYFPDIPNSSGDVFIKSSMDLNLQNSNLLGPFPTFCQHGPNCKCVLCLFRQVNYPYEATKFTEHTYEGKDANAAPAPASQRFHCPEPGCEKSYSKKDRLKKHIAAGHQENKPSFACPLPVCGRTFTTLNSCKRHERMHQKDKGDLLPFTCAHCKNTLSRPDSVLEHQRKHCKVLRESWKGLSM